MDELLIVATLRFVAGVGSVGVVLYFLTRFGMYWGWYQKLDSWGKNFVAAVIASLVAVGAWALVKYIPAEFWLAIDEPFSIVVGVVSSVFGFKGLHFLRNKVGPVVNGLIGYQKLIESVATEAQPIPPGPAAPPKDNDG